MARKPKNDAASVRARLQNLAREQQANFQRVLARYALERFLFRLSVSPYKELFVLKGAMLYTAWLEDPFRTTRDLDLLSLAAAIRATFKTRESAIPCERRPALTHEFSE